MTYPSVLGELETLYLVTKGRSVARYGDGEINLCVGRPAKAQRPDASLASRLNGILQGAGDCLVGIPNLNSRTPKAKFWQPYKASTTLLADRQYVSSFVTRPDSAPWIDTPEYWALVESLWKVQDVVLVRGNERSLTGADLEGASHITEIVGPRVNAWAEYDTLLEAVRSTTGRVLLCLGPTATVMAADLCKDGRHAIDAGHLGMFWKKHRRGEPMIVTDQDKAA